MLASSVPSVPPSLPEIEARFRGKIWRGDALGASADPIVSSGFDELDKELPGGGWPGRNLTELLLPAEGLGEIQLLSRALGPLTRSGRNILLVAPPHMPYMHAWERLDIDSRRIVIVKACKPGERTWALEQGIRSTAFSAVLGWLPEVSLQMTRRLQIIARTSASLVFLFRPENAQAEPSAAPLRIRIGSAAPAAPVWRAGRSHTSYTPYTLSLHLLKRRGARLALPVLITLGRTKHLSAPAAPITVTASGQYHAVDRAPLPHSSA